MPAFVLSEVEFIDEAAAAQYRRFAAASIEQHGGRYRARGVEPFIAEGAAAKGRMVLVEFPTLERIHEWYASPEYAKALAFHDAALVRRLMFFDGAVP